MANEISLSINLTSDKGGASATGTLSLTQDMAGDNFIHNVQTIGTANEAVTLGDVAPGGWQFFKNLDTVNYVEIFLDNANAQLVARLLPGEAAVFKPAAGVYGRANTAACNVLVLVVEL